MLGTTREILKAALRADETITPGDRARFMTLVKGFEKGDQATAPEARLIKRRDAARRLSVSTRTIDALVATGALRKVFFPGRARCAGIPEQDVIAVLEGRATAAASEATP